MGAGTLDPLITKDLKEASKHNSTEGSYDASNEATGFAQMGDVGAKYCHDCIKAKASYWNGSHKPSSYERDESFGQCINL